MKLLVPAAVLLASSAAWADTAGVSAAELKAAFVFNFAKFAEWPPMPAGAPLVLCTYGDDQVSDALAQTVRNQTLDTHPLAVMRLGPGDPTRWCHVLFVAGPDGARIAQFVEDAAPRPVLTVSDGAEFTRRGGMVGLFVDGGRMRFAINVDAVQRSRIHLSSRLLSLATIVRDGHAP